MIPGGPDGTVRQARGGITHFDLANNYGPEPGSAERNDNLKALENTEFTDRELSVIRFITMA